MAMDSEDTKGCHLSVVIDLSPAQWHLSADSKNQYPLSLSSFLSQLLAFLNAHMACKHENTLAVYGAFPGKSVMLYSSTDPAKTDQTIDPNSYPQFKLVNSIIVTRIMEEMDELGNPKEEAPTALVGALTKALCYVNRIAIPPAPSLTTKSERSEFNALLDPRIIILSVSPDLSTSYIPIMNAIFSAQKLIHGPDTVFLQQAAHLTGGSYISLERRDAFLQYLIMAFLSPPSIRKILSVPTQDKIDFRAACFCHKNIVDIGFVCSVCLSIFCQPVPVCSTCRTKFPMKTLQRLQASRPLLATSSNTSTPRSSQSSSQRQTPPAMTQPPGNNARGLTTSGGSVGGSSTRKNPVNGSSVGGT